MLVLFTVDLTHMSTVCHEFEIIPIRGVENFTDNTLFFFLTAESSDQLVRSKKGPVLCLCVCVYVFVCVCIICVCVRGGGGGERRGGSGMGRGMCIHAHICACIGCVYII